jgi:preprotein translocase subunit SecE
MADRLKFILALMLLVSGVAGFYYLAEQPMVFRVLVVLLGVAMSAAVAWFTASGQQFVTFGRESVAEARKVAWPTRRETIQVTGVVFAFVLVMAIVLWAADKGIEWLIYDLVLGWKK